MTVSSTCFETASQYGVLGVIRPQIRFKNPYLVIKKTAWAAPMVNGEHVTRVRRDLPGELLEPMKNASIDQVMYAINAFDNEDIQEEIIAKVATRADLDVDAFFKVRKIDRSGRRSTSNRAAPRIFVGGIDAV